MNIMKEKAISYSMKMIKEYKLTQIINHIILYTKMLYTKNFLYKFKPKGLIVYEN